MPVVPERSKEMQLLGSSRPSVNYTLKGSRVNNVSILLSVLYELLTRVFAAYYSLYADGPR